MNQCCLFPPVSHLKRTKNTDRRKKVFFRFLIRQLILFFQKAHSLSPSSRCQTSLYIAVVQSLSRVRLFATPRTAAPQAHIRHLKQAPLSHSYQSSSCVGAHIQHEDSFIPSWDLQSHKAQDRKTATGSIVEGLVHQQESGEDKYLLLFC